MHLACSAEAGKRDLFFFARLETNCGAGRNIKVHTERFGSAELKRPIDFEEVIVTSNLDWPVAGILDPQLVLPSPSVDLELPIQCQNLTRVHTSCRPASRSNGVMNCDEFRSIRKCPFHLNHWHQVLDAWHDIIRCQQRGAEGNRFRYGSSFAGAFEDFIGYISHRLRMIQG